MDSCVVPVYRRLPHDSSTRALVRLDTNDYNSRHLKRSCIYIFNVQLVNIGLKKKFFFSFFTPSESEENPESHDLFELAEYNLRLYMYKNCLADFYIRMMYEIYANACHEIRGFFSFNGSR